MSAVGGREPAACRRCPSACSDPASLRAAIWSLLGDGKPSLRRVAEVLRVPPVRLHTIPGIPSGSFPYTTDIPLLERWGVPLLYGPGSFLLAHTDEEQLDLREFDAAIGGYVQIVTALS